MATLSELKTKYGLGDGAIYEPYGGCKFCRGSGERTTKSGKMSFCICLYVDHDLSNFAGESLGETARKIKEEWTGKPQ